MHKEGSYEIYLKIILKHLKAKCFINNVLEKRATINNLKGTSYTLKHRVEELLYHYFKGEYNYISNGTFIAALDSCDFKIKERKYLNKKSLNVYTNYKT